MIVLAVSEIIHNDSILLDYIAEISIKHKNQSNYYPIYQNPR